MPVTTSTAGEEIARVDDQGQEDRGAPAERVASHQRAGEFCRPRPSPVATRAAITGCWSARPIRWSAGVLTLSNCLETVLWNGQALELSTFEFSDRFAPEGYTRQQEFRRDIGASTLCTTPSRWTCASRSTWPATSDTVIVEYTFDEVREPVDFIAAALRRPCGTSIRSRNRMRPWCAGSAESMVLIQNGAIGDCILQLSCPAMIFASDPQWWFNFIYRVNKDRGISHAEDLWAPGLFKGHIESPAASYFRPTWAAAVSPSHGAGRCRCDQGGPAAPSGAANAACRGYGKNPQDSVPGRRPVRRQAQRAPPASARPSWRGSPGSPTGAGTRSSRCPDCCWPPAGTRRPDRC